jgi:hypothetical protein
MKPATGARNIILALVPLGFAAAAVYMGGTHDPAQGLAAYFTPSSVESRFAQALEPLFEKRALAASLDQAGVVVPPKPIPSKGTDPVDGWTITSQIADALTSTEARGRLARRIASTLCDQRFAIVQARVIAKRRQGRRPLVQFGITPNEMGRQVANWLSSELPDGAINGYYAASQAHQPPPGTGQAIRAQVEKYLSPKELPKRLDDFVEQDLDATKMDAAIATLASRDFSSRAVWAISATLFATLALASILLGYRWCRDTGKWWARAILCVAIVVAALAALLEIAGVDLGPPLLVGPFRNYAKLYDLRLASATTILNALAAMAIVLLIGSAWSGLRQVSSRAELRARLEALQGSMNLATALLVAGVMEIYAVSRWAGAFASTDAGRAASNDAATAAALAVGVLFSAVLLFLYVPGIASLKNAGTSLVMDQTITPEELQAMLSETGLNESGWGLFRRVLQVLFPILISAPVSGVTQLLSN